MLCEFGEMGEGAIIYHILSPIGCLLLLLLVIRTARGEKRKKTGAKKFAVPQIIETRSDIDMFCHNCGNELQDGAVFCSSCGTKIQINALSSVRPVVESLRMGADILQLSCGISTESDSFRTDGSESSCTLQHHNITEHSWSASPTGVTRQRYWLRTGK